MNGPYFRALALSVSLLSFGIGCTGTRLPQTSESSDQAVTTSSATGVPSVSRDTSVIASDVIPEGPSIRESSPVLDLVDREGAPDGFGWYRIGKGDTPGKICGTDPACQDIFFRVNRVDAHHLVPGRRVLVPIAMDAASRYVPIPSACPEADGERRIVVYLDSQYFGAYEHGQLVFWGPISSGSEGRGTPAGRYDVTYKQKDKRSIKYDNAPMPYSMNLSGTGYFLHQQALPGHRASHGCVRLLMDDAKRLFFWIRVGDPVDIVERMDILCDNG